MRAAGSLRVRTFGHGESSPECVAGWNMNCLQMSPGVLAGESIDLELPSIQLLFERYRNVSTCHSGMAPGDALVFGIADAMAGEGRLNGRPWGDGVAAFDSRQELVSYVPPVQLVTLVVDRERLYEHARITERVDLAGRAFDQPVVIGDAALAQGLMQRLQPLRDACLQRSLGTLAPAQRQLEDELLDMLCALVVPSLCPVPQARRELHHVEVVRRARAHVQAHADEPLRIVDLCRTLGVSRRWLQWSFNEVLGVGPKAYLQLLRLNAARRMLLQASPGRKVIDAVEAYGFWHLSRFSHDYRHHFGELPSQTLRRALARH